MVRGAALKTREKATLVFRAYSARLPSLKDVIACHQVALILCGRLLSRFGFEVSDAAASAQRDRGGSGGGAGDFWASEGIPNAIS